MSKRKVILITGISSGIGYSLYKYFCNKPEFDCYGLVKNKTSLSIMEKTKKVFNKKNIILADLSDTNTLQKNAELSQLDIDIIINNAGHYESKYFLDFSFDSIIREMNINFLSPLFLIHHYGKKMRLKRQGKIINISSGSGIHGGLLPGIPYALSKNSINFLTRILAKEFSSYHITINTIVARFVQTKMLKDFTNFYKKHTGNEFKTSLKIYRPEEVADEVWKLINNHQIKNGDIIELI